MPLSPLLDLSLPPSSILLHHGRPPLAVLFSVITSQMTSCFSYIPPPTTITSGSRSSSWCSSDLASLFSLSTLFHPMPAPAHLLEVDAHVALWIYATLADPLVDHVINATTTYTFWKKIHDFFLANHATHYMLLNRHYHNLRQGDLSVTEYARRMKYLTDGLADNDNTVTEVNLTTQFLHDLDKCRDTIRVVLGDQALPFDTVLSHVILSEESMEHQAVDESASIFALSGVARPWF
ncbi:hypothetical protein D1007_49612 [Hordeum vulgare]|nr:hypothetical protein D1007_49612 [Hordeum vulgare]